MELADFGQVVRRIREKNNMDIGFGEDVAFSLPVVARRGAEQYDAMFLYQNPPEEKTAAAPRPFAWVLLDAATGRVALISRCDLVDFLPEGRYPPGAELPMPPLKVTGKKLAAMRDRVLEAYGEIRAFSFEEQLSRPQAATVSVYKDLFGKLTYPAHYPFYHALSPVFFHWLRMPLPKESAGDPSGGQADLSKDGYQLVILENLQQLVRQFQDKIATDAHKELLFNEMHRELQEYKNDLLGALTQGLERDIIRVIDDLGKSMEAYRVKEPDAGNYARLLALFEGVETDLTDLLYRHGVEPYVQDGIDVTRQKVVHTIATGEPALDKTVAARLARGWEKDGKVIRPERVSVYVYNEPRENAAAN